jgi:hypothetical protein
MTTTLLVAGAVVAVGGVGLYFLSKPAAAAPLLPPVPTPTGPTTPQNYTFGTNNNGGSVTLHPGDTVSFVFPNDLAAASAPLIGSFSGSDWFWTIAPLLTYNGRTVFVAPTQLQETDTFTYAPGGAAGGSTRQIQAQFLVANNPALPTSGPNPPVATPQANVSTFSFTINTASP